MNLTKYSDYSIIKTLMPEKEPWDVLCYNGS